MLPSQPPDESVEGIPADIRAQVMTAVLDELTRLADLAWHALRSAPE